jgi:hypothetical protein
MAQHVFVSYSTKDKAVADAVSAKLEEDGVHCWIAPRDIVAGADWNSAIIEAISASRAMVLILSSNSNTSPDVILEVKHAFRKGISVIPFRIEEVTPIKSLEYYLSFVQSLDALTPPLAEHLRRLSERVRDVIDQRNPSTDVKAGDKPSLAGYRPTTLAQDVWLKARRRWVVLVITVGLLGLVSAFLWRDGRFRAEQPPSTVATPADVPAPADKLPFKVDYPVRDGEWVYAGWDPERFMRKPVVERLALEDELRKLLKSFPRGGEQNAQWHALHLSAKINPPLRVQSMPLTNNKLSCASCHKTFTPVDRESPRATCTECHIVN